MSERLFVSWLITERCNFRCSYCSIFNPFTTQKRFLRKFKKITSRRKWPSPKYDLHTHLDDVLKRFMELERDVCFGFTGGEPLVYPRFLEMLSRITAHDRFTIALDTNLAIKDVGELMRAVPPEKVEYIFSSLHAEERERLYGNYDKFLEDVLTLRKNGYSVEVSYPLPPYLLDRFRADYEYCMERGVELAFRVFKGVHDGKAYPESYTAEELQKIFLEHSPDYNRDRVKGRELYGRRCNAGKDLVRVRGNGDMTPCLADNTLLGNVYTGFRLNEEPVICRVPYCGSWSLENLFCDSTEHVEIEEPPPLTYLERQRQTFHKLKGWWQGD
jgi:MoaA/NifB/PqqE/SkfB family radical SAM enzyme